MQVNYVREKWFNEPLGKRLRKLHAWNAWSLLALTVTGLLLLVPELRGMLGEGRVWIKQLHIVVGIVSAGLLLAYVPLLRKHWRQIRGRAGQRANLLFVLALLIGWCVSGIVLWQLRSLPAQWSSAALFWHDALTWVGVPYALYHSVSRSRWVKRASRGASVGKAAGASVRDASDVGAAAGYVSTTGAASAAGSGGADGAVSAAGVAGAAGAGAAPAAPAAAGASAPRAQPHAPAAGPAPAQPAAPAAQKPAAAAGQPPSPARAAADAALARLAQTRLSRGAFLRGAAGLALLLLAGPPFYRWLKGALGGSGVSLQQLAATNGGADGGAGMLPAPTPLPDSMPPKGGGLSGNFRIYTVTDFPSFTADNWQFAISGLVEEPALYNWEQFLKLPRHVQVCDFHCVTGWSVYNITYEGILLKDLLALVKPKIQAKYVKLYSGDGVYTDALSLEQAGMDDVMVAVLMDGQPIPQKLGGPVRLIVPQMYAYKSVKWLNGIELIDKEHLGYWEVRGYDNDAWVNGKRT
ncbi:molybdopterin-dependent oxidoreductase [Paenibacillus chartarius]|uniref:Molybdopterin-dependent oxidoreductase n=1 Tax=Paenibacillus chartarius TaxID=747481 RepID=A0ABV6DRD9_9BACL